MPAQSIRSRRYRSLQRVKPHTPEAGHASNPKITIQTEKAHSTKSNYIQDSAVEAPTGAAEPVPAQSNRSRRLSSLQRVKPHTPEAGHASNPKNHNTNKQSTINISKLLSRFSCRSADRCGRACASAEHPESAISFPAACETTHPRSRPRIKPKNHNTNKPTTINKIKLLLRFSC